MEIVQNTGCVDLGTPVSLQHIAGRWQIEARKTKDGTNFFVALPKNIFFFDSTALEDQTLQIRWKSQRHEPQQVKILMNENLLQDGTAHTQWSLQEYNIPLHHLRFGENILRFESTGRQLNLAIDSICIANVPNGSVLPAYMRVPEETKMEVKFGIDQEKSDWGSATQFEIWIDEDDGGPTKLHSKIIERGLFFETSTTAQLDLSRWSGKIVGIKLAAIPAKGKKPATVDWEKAQLLVKSSAAAENKKTVSSTAKTISKKPRNIFFYLIDTLRRDHLEPYGYSRATSPRILEFARDAVLFEHAYAQTTWTRASIACIQTGVYQSSHLVEDRADVLPSFLPTLQEKLKSNRFFTMGIVTNANLINRFGLNRGFQIYHMIPGSKKKPGISPHSGEVFALAEKVLQANKNQQPIYMYVHVMDPHQPYAPEIGAPQHRGIPQCNVNPDSEECHIAKYDGEVYNSDYYFGKFLDRIKQLGLYEDSLIVLTADHGESLGEHEAGHHGTTLYNSEITVPLLMKFPDHAFAGKRIQTPVEHIDIFPTILSLLSLPIPPGVQGENLIPVLTDSTSKPRQVFSEILLDEADKKSMVDGQYKIIANTIQDKITRQTKTYYEIYDLSSDPKELRNIYLEKPVLSGLMKSELNRWSVKQAARKATLKKPQGANLDEETKELLRALGYAQ